jgi:hypothetical protein
MMAERADDDHGVNELVNAELEMERVLEREMLNKRKAKLFF